MYNINFGVERGRFGANNKQPNTFLFFFFFLIFIRK